MKHKGCTPYPVIFTSFVGALTGEREKSAEPRGPTFSGVEHR